MFNNIFVYELPYISTKNDKGLVGCYQPMCSTTMNNAKEFEKPFVYVNVKPDDDTYVSGDLAVISFGDNGELLEPYIYKDAQRKVECYISKNIWVEKVEGKIVKVIYTSTCWSGDWRTYYVEDDNIVKIVDTYHGMNKCYITFEKGFVSEIEYSRRKWISGYKIGDFAPKLDELI